jgi:hypothetical protein
VGPTDVGAPAGGTVGSTVVPTAASTPPARSGVVPGPSAFARLLQAGIVVVTVLEILDEMRLLRRRWSRDSSDWWAGVERRERVQLHRAEIGYLMKGASRLRR